MFQPECGNAVQLEDQKSEAVSRNIDNIEDERTDFTASENNHQNVSMAGSSLTFSFCILHCFSNVLLLLSI